jgi:hypothetical protein
MLLLDKPEPRAVRVIGNIDVLTRLSAASWSPYSPATPNQATLGHGWGVAIRIAVVLVALGILYLRMPESFSHPQLYAEDNDFLYNSRANGWSSLSAVMGGYLVWMQLTVAILASYFSPAAAPAIYNYAAFALTLVVVWMVTSPRLDMPYKPLLGIAVVIVPMGYEELGTLTNIQWIVPIGAVALMLSRAPASPVALAGETIFVTLTAFSGPFSIFLAPMFLWQLLTARGMADRRRLLVLTAIVGLGALTQAVVLLHHPSIMNLAVPAPYSWTVWVNLPFTQFMTTFGHAASALFHGTGGAILGLILLAAATALAFLKPYRTQKLLMLFFALAIAVSGMYKFRAALESQSTSQRYFYAGSVFALWFLCCLTDRRYLRSILAAMVALIEVTLLPVVANTPRFAADLEWPVWAGFLTSGLPIIIPDTPAGFYLSLPATPAGPLARYAPLVGRPLAELAAQTDPSACKGALDPVNSAGMIYLQPVRREKDLWITQGTAWDVARNRPVQLVALVDGAGQVLGYGLPGFKSQDQAGMETGRSGWKSVFYADPGTTLRAYGILDDGARICPLANQRFFPMVTRPLASGPFAGGVEILPGKDVVQRFRPTQRLEQLSLALVTWGRVPSRYKVDWRMVATSRGRTLELGAGTIDAGTIRDWQRLTLPVTLVPDEVPDQIEVTFRADAATAPVAPLSLPLYMPAADTTAPPAEVGGMPAPSGARLGLSPAYAQ